jgi:hypothetical protein
MKAETDTRSCGLDSFIEQAESSLPLNRPSP